MHEMRACDDDAADNQQSGAEFVRACACVQMSVRVRRAKTQSKPRTLSWICFAIQRVDSGCGGGQHLHVGFGSERGNLQSSAPSLLAHSRAESNPTAELS